jgi:hypothetical protein
MALIYLRFTAVLLLIYGSIFLNGVFYCLCFGVLHRDNSPAHTPLPVSELLASKQITVLKHPPSSLDLASSYFILFSKIKKVLKGRHFNDIDDIRSITTAALKAIRQNQFQNCFERWTKR